MQVFRVYPQPLYANAVIVPCLGNDRLKDITKLNPSLCLTN
jgi:hypothetical protein